MSEAQFVHQHVSFFLMFRSTLPLKDAVIRRVVIVPRGFSLTAKVESIFDFCSLVPDIATVIVSSVSLCAGLCHFHWQTRKK